MIFEDFIRAVAPIFEGEVLSYETKFRELASWNSLAGLSLIAVIDDDFGVLLNGNDIRSVETFGALFELVKSK